MNSNHKVLFSIHNISINPTAPGENRPNSYSSEDESSLSTIFIIGFGFLFLIVAVAVAFLIIRKIKRDQSSKTSHEIPIRYLENQLPSTTSPSICFSALRCNNGEKKVLTAIPLSNAVKDLWFVIRDDNNIASIIEVTNREAFGDSGLTLQQRVDLKPGDEIMYNNTHDVMTHGIVLFKGSQHKARRFVNSFQQPENGQLGNQNNENLLLERIIIIEKRLNEYDNLWQKITINK